MLGGLLPALLGEPDGIIGLLEPALALDPLHLLELFFHLMELEVLLGQMDLLFLNFLKSGEALLRGGSVVVVLLAARGLPLESLGLPTVLGLRGFATAQAEQLNRWLGLTLRL